MWLLGCNLRRDLYILFSVKRIFVTVDRIFIDLCNPRRHKNIWRGPYFIQTRGPWHNLWQIMSFSTLTFCARVWNIANMLRYKVVSGEMFLAAPWLTGAHSSRLTEPTGNSNAPSSGGSRGLVTLYVSCALCEPFNVRHMSHLCVSLQQRKNLCINTNCKFAHQVVLVTTMIFIQL